MKILNVFVIFINLELWTKLLNILPMTSKDVEYGTPQMANEMIRLWNSNERNVKDVKVIVMGGHKEGLISVG